MGIEITNKVKTPENTIERVDLTAKTQDFMEAKVPVEEPVAKEETPTVPTEEPAKDSFEQRFEKLTKKEAELVAKEASLKSKVVLSEEDAKTYQEVKTIKEMFKQDPIKAIEQLGGSYEQITQYLLTGGAKDPNAEKFNELQKKIDEFENKNRQQEFQTAYNKWSDEAVEYLKTNDEKYAVTNSYTQEEKIKLLADITFKHYQDTQEELNIAKASDMLEAQLEERDTKEINRIIKIKKIKDKIEELKEQKQTQEVKQETEELKEELKAAAKKTKTLSNTDATVVPKRKGWEPDSVREARAKAKLGL